MVLNLEPEDIKKLRKELFQGYLYGVSVFVFFVILFIFSLSGAIMIDPVVVLFLGFALTFLVVWLFNGTLYKDLKSGKKEVVNKPIEFHEDERKIKKSKTGALVEAWGFKKRKKKKKFLIHINNATFEVTENMMKKAESAGNVEVHYSLYHKKVLRITIPENQDLL